MNIRNLALPLACLALFATSCKECKKTEENIIKPTTALGAFLDTRPSGQDIAKFCPVILDQIKEMPEGTDAIRTLARAKYLRTEDFCEEWKDSWRMVCRPGYPTGGACYPERYTYCVKWHHSETPLPGYDQAIALSQDLDELYRLTQSMCMDALSGRLDEAYGQSIAVQDLFKGKIKQAQSEFYQAACSTR